MEDNFFNVVIPVILMAENEKKDGSYEPKRNELVQLISNISAVLFETPTQKYGLISANIEGTGNIDFLWHADIYNFEVVQTFGDKSKYNTDLMKIKKESLSEIFEYSMQFTIDDNDENSALMEGGEIKIKIGKGKDKRLYKVYYTLVQSSIDELLEKVAEESEDEGIKNEANDLLYYQEGKKVIH